MDTKDIENVIGSLSNVTKIPFPGFSTSATECHMGAILSKIKGSTCSCCYAKQGHNLRPVVQAAYKKRSEAIDEPYWVDFMAELILRNEDKRRRKHQPTGYFRWFNSGDLKNYKHLEKIVEICERTPDIKHWLPTKEYGWVRQFLLKFKKFPENLTVRLSSYMIGQKAPRKFGLPGAGVVWYKSESNCPAYDRPDKSCGDCRKCWDKRVKEIYYPWHVGRVVGKKERG